MVRITQNLLNERSLLFLQQNLSQVAKLQEQLSTGHRINRPADDPVDFPISLNLRSSIQQNRNYQQNITDSRSNLELTENSMQSLTEVLQSLRTLAVQGASDIDVDARKSLAQQVAQQYGYILDLANTNLSGQSIFAGGNTLKPAFTNYNGTVLYQGDDFEKQVALSRSTYIETNLNGYQTFLHTPNQITGSVSIADPNAALAD
jgi:flagellar hook-associated protein 3 FlgL